MASVSLPALFVFVVVLTVRSSVAYNISCEMDVHGNCDKELKLIESSNGVHTWTDEDLSIYCREIVDNVDCKQDYLEKCSNETVKYRFEQTTADLRDLAQEICNETSDLRTAFKSHNACIRNASNEYGDCMGTSILESVAKVYGNGNNTTEVERTVNIICRLYEIFTECVSAAVEKSCGRDAAEFVGTMLTRPFTRLRIDFCVEGRWSDYIERMEKYKEFNKNRYLVTAGALQPLPFH